MGNTLKIEMVFIHYRTSLGRQIIRKEKEREKKGKGGRRERRRGMEGRKEKYYGDHEIKTNE